MFQQLLVQLFVFLEPYLRNTELNEPIRLLYKGTLRVLLVLLHDFPEFLCDHHFAFCDVIPPSCIQMRNLILSAFPRNMRLPDPFTPNLKVDLLPEINQPPCILSNYASALHRNPTLLAELDSYLKNRAPVQFLLELSMRLLLPQEALAYNPGSRYNVPLINSLVLYVGIHGISQLQIKSSSSSVASPISHSPCMDIFQHLALDLDNEGRYLFLNAIANQLRYPNNNTHYFSCVLLYLFADANQPSQEIIQEQITRYGTHTHTHTHTPKSTHMQSRLAR
jgi:CCR4-NOT transcription complex subunit 1